MSENPNSKVVTFLAPPSPKNVNGGSSDTLMVDKLTPEVRRRRHTMDRDSKTAEHRFFRRSVICDSNATALDLPSQAVILTSPIDCEPASPPSGPAPQAAQGSLAVPLPSLVVSKVAESQAESGGGGGTNTSCSSVGSSVEGVVVQEADRKSVV